MAEDVRYGGEINLVLNPKSLEKYFELSLRGKVRLAPKMIHLLVVLTLHSQKLWGE